MTPVAPSALGEGTNQAAVELGPQRHDDSVVAPPLADPRQHPQDAVAVSQPGGIGFREGEHLLALVDNQHERERY